ncbi:MAG: AAA family ATPase [Myxococcales bacterium]|nr:AAA family ATPase [Myxococcales bacterium]
MSFLETVRRAKGYLHEEGRVSLRALKREFALDDETLDELVDELVEIQSVAVLEGRALAWAGPPASLPSAAREDPRDYTPKHLADKILESKSALEGERKQVTVLFADVKGSMELAEALDPEEWHSILDRFFQILTEGVHRFEGTVNQYTGDGIMALFGAPIAHEDHARRACYAALQLRDEIERYSTEVKRQHGVSFSMRMGLNSGEVVVGKIGDDLRMDYTAQGHTVGLAQRMESLASPNTCYLTHATAQLVFGYFELEDLGAFRVKGASEPARVHRLVGVGAAHSRFDISRARGLTRFVGRDADMATLEAALAESQAGNGQVVGIVAEAGTGKSRLSFEFVEQCRAKGMTVNQATAVAHGKNIPYLPMLQVFRAYYGVQEQDDDRSIREKIAGRMLLLDEAFRDVLPVLFEFFGVPDPERPAPRMDPEAKQRQLFSVLRRLVQGADSAGTTNLFTLIEDLHWLDAGSEAFLEQWVDAIAGSSSFLLVNFRPEYHADWMQKSYYRQLPLAPLGPDALRDLLDDLLGADPSTRGLADAIYARTGGNPFFTEEVVQSLIESGQLEGTRGAYRLATPIGNIDVPPTVQSVLAARIDRLPEREKQVLQAAAVIGKEFAEPILLAAAELPEIDLRAALATLKSTEFVFEQSLYPVAEYSFKHPLTQAVALRSQLKEPRQRRHAAVARAIEGTHAGKLDEVAGLLAHHWEEAGEALLAARWHGHAAEWVGVSDPAEALRHWRQVRALVETIPESAETLALAVTACEKILQFSWRLGSSEEDAAADFDEGRVLAERSGDPAPLARLLAAYAAVRGLAGDVPSYLRYAKEAAEAADRTSDRGLQSAVGITLIVAHDRAGDLREALASAEQTIERSRKEPGLGVEVFGLSPYIFALWFRGRLLTDIGRHEEAKSSLDLAEALSRQHGEAENLAWTLGQGYGALARNTGDYQAAVKRAREAVEIAEKIGSHFSQALAYEALSEALNLDGECSGAAAAAERSLLIARDTRTGLMDEAAQLVALANAHVGLGDTDRGCELAEEAVEVARRRSTRVYEARALLTLARGLTEEGRAEFQARAEEALKRALSLIDETGNEALRPFVHLEQGRLARRTGEEAGHQRELREAHRLFAEMGATGHAERLAGGTTELKNG